jgi:thioredoxin reductase (NADPH)
MTTTRIKAEQFPDLDDPVLYPRLPAHKMEWLAHKGARRSFAEGEVLYEAGVRDAPFYVIESGRVDLIDRKPGKEVWIAEADGGTFIGDIATFTGEPAMARCVAAEPTETIVFDRPGLRALLAASPEMGELVLGCLLARRAWHEGAGHGVLRLIAERGSRRAFDVRDLLERNLVPLRFHDVDLEPYADKILDWLDVPREETPVLVRHDCVMRNPSAAQVARALGLRAEPAPAGASWTCPTPSASAARGSTTPPCRPTPSASATRTSWWWAAATRPARRPCISRGTRAACAWRSAARRSPRRCRATSSTASSAHRRWR